MAYVKTLDLKLEGDWDKLQDALEVNMYINGAMMASLEAGAIFTAAQLKKGLKRGTLAGSAKPSGMTMAIREGGLPALSKHPLVDTGQLINSIAYSLLGYGVKVYKSTRKVKGVKVTKTRRVMHNPFATIGVIRKKRSGRRTVPIAKLIHDGFTITWTVAMVYKIFHKAGLLDGYGRAGVEDKDGNPKTNDSTTFYHNAYFAMKNMAVYMAGRTTKVRGIPFMKRLARSKEFQGRLMITMSKVFAKYIYTRISLGRKS